MVEKCFYLGSDHFSQMPLLVEQGKAFDPSDIGLLGWLRIFLQAKHLTHAVEYFRILRHNGLLPNGPTHFILSMSSI